MACFSTGETGKYLIMTRFMISFPEILLIMYPQILGYIAKGSFGPILKVKDKSKQKTYAVKVNELPRFSYYYVLYHREVEGAD